MASESQLSFNAPHEPQKNAIEAFNVVLEDIKREIIKSRRDWDKHEPRMWSRAAHLSDHQLKDFSMDHDLVLVSSASTSYGTIVIGKIRIPAVHDDLGAGYVHVRIHDPPNRGIDDVKFHSLFTDEGGKDHDGHPTIWRAIQTEGTPLKFFNE